MPDENGTEATRPDAVSVEESIFGDAGEKADDVPAEAVEKTADEESEQDAADAGDKPDAQAGTDAADELKVVVSIKGGRAVIGVQQPSSDPHIETFEDYDLPALAQEVVEVTERAKEKWEDAPKHPAARSPGQAPQQPAPAGGGDERQRPGRDGAGGGAADAEAVLGPERNTRGEGCRNAVSFPRRPCMRPFLRSGPSPPPASV